LTVSEYDDIANRLEESLKQLELVRDTLSTNDNFTELRRKVDQTCEKLSVRVNILKRQDQIISANQPNYVTDLYKLELTDLMPHRRAYLLLKYCKQKDLKVETGASYLIDKIKLIINKKGEIILISTNLTVCLQSKMVKEDDEDSFDVNSLELSQK
jgi:hypothetical protein|tara:strand:- start:984 stop:1451 length:468 start_codon:yes stop_codon:yes gene_type:complete